MKLFTNGCSFTWGSEILENVFNVTSDTTEFGHVTEYHNTYREESVWSYHLHKLLGTTELSNLSMYSGSNHRIVRTTLDYFINKIDNGQDVTDYLSIIQWTDPSRYEVYHEDLKRYLSILATSIFFPGAQTSGGLRTLISIEEEEILKYRFKSHAKTFYDEWYVHLVCLSNFFDKHKIPYLFCTMNEIALPRTYYTNMTWLGTDSKSNQILNTRNFRYRGKHPDLIGHQFIAKRLYKRLKLLYNI